MKVRIAGGGLSGLTAALAVVRRGGQAEVFETRREIGARFHGDYQGLENWSTDEDVLEELGACGIEPTFEYTPFRELVLFDPRGREHVCRASKPLWYLVRRGTESGTLDQALKAQALAAGVSLRCGERIDRMPEGGIVAHGPRHADAIAVGYLFATDRSDGAYAAVSDELAPGGYAYLLICRGRATLATCMFEGFHDDKRYLARTVQFFERTVGVTLRQARFFGGFGNMAPEPTLRRGNKLIAGEAAGLQDALFGFGMRYAIVSGHLAGKAFADNDLARYERDHRRRFGRALAASAVNRYVYGRGRHRAYQALVDRVTRARDPRAWLRGYYNGHWWTPLLFPLARADAARRRPSLAHQSRDVCDCTYCRCLPRPAERVARTTRDRLQRAESQG